MSNNMLVDLAVAWGLSDLKPNEDRVLKAFKGYGTVEVLALKPGALLVENALNKRTYHYLAMVCL